MDYEKLESLLGDYVATDGVILHTDLPFETIVQDILKIVKDCEKK